MDPFTLLMAAQTAVSFIRKGCDMLHEGRMELEGAKKTVEGVIEDVKAISGMWDWFLGLFKSKEEQPKPIAQKKATAVAKKKQESYEELELKLISDIGANISVLFDTQQQIKNYYFELEEESKTKFTPEQNTSKKAIERALIELQMEKLVEQTREAMVYAPMELKDLYSRFLAMHAKIEREQEWARKEMLNRARIARRKKEQEEIQRIEFLTGVGAVFFISLIFWWFMWELHVLSSG
jgi:hypothetical protein